MSFAACRRGPKDQGQTAAAIDRKERTWKEWKPTADVQRPGLHGGRRQPTHDLVSIRRRYLLQPPPPHAAVARRNFIGRFPGEHLSAVGEVI